MSRNQRGLWLIGLLVLAQVAHGEKVQFPRAIAQWREAAPPPPQADRQARDAWFHSANYSKLEWGVFDERGEVVAEPARSRAAVHGPTPGFSPEAGKFHRASEFARVDDGWLVGFNQGEFGAALYWFSTDGKSNYKISDHHVVDFFSMPDGIRAIEGLAHGISKGSVISIGRLAPGAHWQAETVMILPFAPYAVSVRRDGSMLITLSDSLVSVGRERRVVTLHSQPLWNGLYPSSSVLSAGERKLYIGMRQYVVEFDLATKAIRYLVPQ